MSERLPVNARRRRLVLVLLPTLLLGAWLLLIGLPPFLLLSPADQKNYETLIHAEYFAGRAVGYGAVEAPEARAFMALAARPHGGTALKYVLLRGGRPGKIYALVGLRRTNPLFFSVAIQPFRLWPSHVTTFFGCIVSSEPARTLVESKDPDAVRLHRGQTLVDWYRTHPRGTVVLDVIGGGYTSMFFEWEQITRPAA